MTLLNDGRLLRTALPSRSAGGTVLFGSVRLSIWYLDLTHKEIDSARLRADLAVAEERLRFSRDLHDIFGRTLTTVAVKSDLAAELAASASPEVRMQFQAYLTEAQKQTEIDRQNADREKIDEKRRTTVRNERKGESLRRQKP